MKVMFLISNVEYLPDAQWMEFIIHFHAWISLLWHVFVKYRAQKSNIHILIFRNLLTYFTHSNTYVSLKKCEVKNKTVFALKDSCLKLKTLLNNSHAKQFDQYERVNITTGKEKYFQK